MKNRRSIMKDDHQVMELDKNTLFDIQKKREWLSTEEASYFLSISTNALRIMVYRGQIKAYKFGRRLRFKLSDCRALFKNKENCYGN